MKRILLVQLLLLTGCAGLGTTAPGYAIGTYKGALIGRGSCTFPAADITLNVAKWSAYGDWYFEQQNVRGQFVDGWVNSEGFLWGRRLPQVGMVYVGGFFASDGSEVDARIDTESCSYRGSLPRT